MGSKLTYTGVVGPGQALTAAVFNDVKELSLIPESGILKVRYGSNEVKDLDLQARSTITITIASGVITATVS